MSSPGEKDRRKGSPLKIGDISPSFVKGKDPVPVSPQGVVYGVVLLASGFRPVPALDLAGRAQSRGNPRRGSSQAWMKIQAANTMRKIIRSLILCSLFNQATWV